MSFARESDRHDEFLTALKYPALTSLFDTVVRVLFRERDVKARLVAEVALRPAERALDIGCGTGTLAILLKRSTPDATVVGLDGDQAVLEIARRKAARAKVDIKWDAGMAQSLPYPDGSFDVVSSTLVLHHLRREDRIATIREAYRVLRPGGAFHVVEFTRPRGRLMFALAKISELLEETEDGVEGRLPGMFRNAGFDPVEQRETFATPLGTIALFRSSKQS